VPAANPASSFCSRSSVVAAPELTCSFTFGWAAENCLARPSNVFSKSADCPVHQVSVTGADVSTGAEALPPLEPPLQPARASAAPASPAIMPQTGDRRRPGARRRSGGGSATRARPRSGRDGCGAAAAPVRITERVR
jgi:hypothetical protein